MLTIVPEEPPEIDAHFVFNETMRCLVEEYFLPSLPVSIKPQGHLLDLWSSGNYDRDNYYEVLQLKTRRIIEIIADGPPDSLVIYCDVDLVFLGDPVADLFRHMEERDLAYQREWANNNEEANSGFQVIRRNPRTLRFYEEVLWHQQNFSPPNDQLWVNHVLRRPGAPAWTLLPCSYSSGSNGGLRHDSILYHANNTPSNSMARKKEALDRAMEARSAATGAGTVEERREA